MSLSIIIPAFNLEEVILECLTSIIVQDSSEELIVLDDGSIDKTPEKVEEFLMMYANIILVKKYNRGVAQTRNIGLQLANKEYIWFIDGDDYIFEYSIRILKKVVITNLDFYCFDYVKTSKRYHIKYDEKSTDVLSRYKTEVIKFDDLHKYLSFSPQSVSRMCVKRCIANKIAFRNLKVCEDYLYALSVASMSKQYGLIHEVLYYYYQRDGSCVHNMNGDYLYDFLFFCEELIKIGKTNNTNLLPYFFFIVRETIIPCSMDLLVKNIEDSVVRKRKYKEFCNKIYAIYSNNHENMDLSLRYSVKSKMYLVGYILLYLRHMPRKFLSEHRKLLKIYRIIRRIENFYV